MKELKSYYFTKRHHASDKEALEAKNLGFTLINGMFADSFNRDCEAVAGNYPEHLKDKAVKKPRSQKITEQVV